MILHVFGCITQEHDLRLVILAVLISVVGCFTTLHLLSRYDHASPAARNGWLAASGIIFGLGVWTTHFVAMLAFRPGLPVGYEVGTTMLSIGIAALGAIAALMLYCRATDRLRAAFYAGPLLGGSIAAMHFVGMAAMRLNGVVTFDVRYVAASVVLVSLLCIAGLRLALPLDAPRKRIVGAIELSLAICSLHFVDMAAVTITPGLGRPQGELLMSSGPLAIAVAAIGMLLILLSLFGSIMDQHLDVRSAREARRLRQMAEATFEGLLIHRGGVILDVNEAFCRLVARPASQAVGRNVGDLVIPEEREAIVAWINRGGRETVEVHLVVADGRTVPVEVLSRAIEHEGQPAWVLAMRDLSDRKRAEEQIRHLAHHDGLTGLPNRFLFQDRLRQSLELSARTHGGLAVLCLDLDRFKYVNDLLGHAAGDQLMIQVADRLRAVLRASDTAARLGSDEFAIVQPFVKKAEDVASLAQRVIDAISRPFQIDDRQVEIGTSIGMAIYPGDGASPDRLLKNADTALYRAKQDGRGGFRFFEEAIDRRLQERRLLEQDLRQAIARGQMDLHYQPIVGCDSQEILGFEALLRWNHPERGRMSPADFIPLAEECGLMMPLGKWVLQTACQTAARWPEHCVVAVNLSPTQFRQPDLPRIVTAILKETGLPASRLELEVTEGLLIDNTDRALAILTALKQQGIRISLDDFGTGYSSLSYLRRFPFDKIKIDRSFVQGLGEDKDADTIVEAIVALARSLRLDVTAEGVETEHQLDLLRQYRCNQVQGFLLGRPMSSASLDDMMLGDRVSEDTPTPAPGTDGLQMLA